MAFLDRFRRKKNKKTGKRNFTGANAGRLFNDWKATSSSPDAELENNLKILRDRCRDLARNNPIVQRYFQLIKQGTIGNGQGFKIQVHSRNVKLGTGRVLSVKQRWKPRCYFSLRNFFPPLTIEVV